MTTLSDDDLVAYADGELEPGRRAEVEAALEQDAAARERLRRLTRADELVREAYGSALDQPVPNHLRDAVERANTGDRVVRLNPAARLKVRAREMRRPVALAASIALCVGLAVGYLLAGLGSVPTAGPGVRLAGSLDPDSGIGRALESTPSGEVFTSGEAAVAPLSTFRTAEGRFCRTYQARRGGDEESAVVEAVACRGAGGAWRNEAVVAASTAGDSDYRPAAGDTRASLRELRPAWRAAAPLDAEAERTAIGAGWARPVE